MNPTTTHLLIFSLTILFLPNPTISNDQPSHISFTISTKGIDFIKDVLISKAITSLTPLHIPQVNQSRNIPFLGNVFVQFSDITIHQIGVLDSTVGLGGGGDDVAFIVSGAKANLSLSWGYSYFAGWFFPVKVSDHGLASVQVEGMQVGLTLGLRNQEGTLKLTLKECGCFVENLTIKLEGGASWLYQGFVDAFAGQIEAAVEQAITQKLKEGVLELDSFLESLPNEIPVDDISSLNITFVNDLVLRNSSIAFEIDGLFSRREQMWTTMLYHEHLQPFSCDAQSKMIGISIDEAVFRSASNLYFDAGYLQWIVDKIPNQALLNTAGWRFIIPQLYKKYPHDDMNLNVSLASPPLLRINPESMDVTVSVDFIINVLEGGEVIPVACILLEIQASGSVKIRGNNLGGKVKLGDFKMSLKWSKIGDLKMFLVQPVIWTVVETVLLPYANARLWKGFPLPMIQGFTLKNGKVTGSGSSLIICSDVSFTDTISLPQLGKASYI